MDPKHDPASSTAGQARILVCDDAPTIRSLMAMLLGRSYVLKLTASAEEALEKAPEFSPDLVVTDLLPPGMNGRELVRQLRAIPAFEEVPMILLTSVGDTDSRADGLEAGADDYLVKPIRERELLARVASLLRLRRAMLSLSQRTRALEDLNLRLRETQQRLGRSERLAAAGSLAASLAHDINNPLSLVTSSTAALVSVIEEASRRPQPLGGEELSALMDELRGIAGEVTEGARRLQGIGRDLRLFGTAEAGGGASVRAEDAIQSAIALARGRAVAPPPIDLAVNGAPEIEGPPHLVTLALLSILDRAVLSAGAGGHIRVEVAAEPRVCRIAISDDGPRIPLELLPRVFEPFVHLHPPHEARGLGLSVAAGIILGLGGHIDVDGTLAQGACFRVRLPLAPVAG